MNYRFLLGSKSKLKRDVLDEAVRLAGLDVEVVQLDVASHVPEQPYGYAETSVGAINRALNALRTYRRFAPQDGVIILAIAIENGLFPDPVTIDRGCIVIHQLRWKVPIIVYSDGVEVPPELVEESVVVYHQNITAGRLEANRTPGCDHTDPHKVWSNGKTSRRELLIPAMLKALEQVKDWNP